MMQTRSNLLGWLAAAVVLVGSPAVSLAQSGKATCTLQRLEGPRREILKCQNGITITAEDDASFVLRDRDGNGSADAADLDGKALLLDAPRGSNPNGFEVITPQAIAAVRGTNWAVDVRDGKTSVFVVDGSVSVRRPAAKQGVVLGPGEGVDVEAGPAPLTVRRWPAARVSALMARFGR